MRKQNWSAYSGAGQIDTLHPFTKKRLDEDAKRVYNIPRVGSIIVVNEIVSKTFYSRWHGHRGCYYVMELTRGGLYLCRSFYNERNGFNTCFKKTDFLNGIYRFIEVEEPIYGEKTSWADYDLKNFG